MDSFVVTFGWAALERRSARCRYMGKSAYPYRSEERGAVGWTFVTIGAHDGQPIDVGLHFSHEGALRAAPRHQHTVDDDT
jgi:hypothetical protein